MISPCMPWFLNPWLPFSSKPSSHSILPLNSNLLTTTFSSSSHLSRIKTIHNSNATQLSLTSPYNHKPILLNDWPQLLKTSIHSRNFMLGLAIHGLLLKLCFQNDAFMGNNLINMYAKFCRMDSALRVFDEMLDRNTITWTSLINGYALAHNIGSVFLIAYYMNRLQVEFNAHTWSVILGACESEDDRVRGEQIHASLMKTGFYDDVVVGTSLMSMYSRCGYLEGVERLFIDLDNADVRCLNLMILEYAKAGNSKRAIGVFLELINSGLEPTDYTLTNILTTCNGDRDVKEDKQLHGLAIKHGHVDKTSVGNATITMYGNHGLVEDASKMFDIMGDRNLVTWTALFSAYVKNGDHMKALKGFSEMVGLGLLPDSDCLATVLDGCSENKNLEFGLQIHAIVEKLGFLCDANVGTALVDLYAKCRKLRYARTVLNMLDTINITCFNAILAGFSRTHEDVDEEEYDDDDDDDDDEENDAMNLFSKLRASIGLRPDSVTFTRLISLSADEACLVGGQCLHAFALKTGFIADNYVTNALISMYAKCGNIQDSHQAFCSTNYYGTISWNAIISAYALNGKSKEAVLLFEEMLKGNFNPDGITILGVLQACIYSKQWEYGLELFNSMEAKYRIRPLIEHFACMVDLLGRAGFLSETVDFINKSPFLDSPLIWRTLVNVCKISGDLNFGKIASARLLDLEPKEAGSYILVCNMFVEMGMFDEASRVRTLMNDLNVKKEAGFSSIVVDNTTHRFLASDKNHPRSSSIYTTVDLLECEVRRIYSEHSCLSS